MSEIQRVGVDQLSLRDISHAAGLTHGATYARFEDADEMLVDLWNSILRERLQEMFELSLSAAQDPNADSVGALFELLRDADARDLAAIELLLTSRRNPILREECESFIRNYLELDEGTSGDSRAIFSRAVLLFGTTMARLYSDRHFGLDENYNNAFEKLLIESLSVSPSEVEAVDFHGPEQTEFRSRFSEGDSLRADLAYATFRVVGKSGYVGATISRIARRANCSPAAIYKSHHSKEDLVVGTFVDILGAQRMKLADVANVLDGDFLAAAMNAGSHERSQLRTNFVLELFLAAGHHEMIREAIHKQLMHLESTVPTALGLDDEEGDRLRYMLRTVITMMIGASWVSALCTTSTDLDFVQFTEPLKRAVLLRWLPDWEVMSRDIRTAAASFSREVQRDVIEAP
ncbi:MAG TPA: TetR family transcriptional regulator [Acidimicrobiales bacterium]